MMLRQAGFFLPILLILYSPVRAAPDLIYELQPKNHESYQVEDGKIYFRIGNTGLILEASNSESIPRYYQERGVTIENPFLDLGGESQQYTVFLLTLINRSSGNIVLNPRYVTLKIKTESFFPMDFAVLVEYMERLDPKLRDILQKSILHSSETVPAGKIVSKFLVFAGLPKKFDEVKLEFPYLFFENQELHPVFYFTRNKLDKN